MHLSFLHYKSRTKEQNWTKYRGAVVTVEDESRLQWPCYECAKRFRTSADLQKHLAVHDGEVGLADVTEADTQNDPECVLPRNTRRGYRRKRQAPFAGSDVPSTAAGNDNDAVVCIEFWECYII